MYTIRRKINLLFILYFKQLYSLCSNDIKSISEALKRNENVTTFNLSKNELETTGCCYLSALLRDNHVIKHLDISRCK